MRIPRRVTAALLVVSAAAAAYAHGGSYRPPGQGGGPGGPPPGPSDDVGPITQWEAWWASNKYLYLDLGSGMRDTAGPVTPSSADAPSRASKKGTPDDPLAVRDAQDALVREALVPLFVEALSDPSFEVRTAAAVALGKAGDPAGLAPLRRAAEKDETLDVRDAALVGLGLLGRQEAVPFLAEVLRDEGATTRHRAFAAFGLGQIGGKSAAEHLVGYMHLGEAPADPADGAQRGALRHRGDPPLHAACFLGMGFSGEDSVLPVLRRAAADRQYDDQVRAFAWLALGRQADRASLPLFEAALADPQEKLPLRRAAAIALGRVAVIADASAVSTLFRAMQGDRDPLVRHFSAATLGSVADATLLAEMRKEFARADAQDRAFLALALGIARDETAAPMLRKALAEERNDSLRGALAIALGMLRDAGARAVLEARVKDRGAVWPQGYAALAIGMARIAESAPLLRTTLEETNDPRLRANLAVGLGLLRDPRAREWFFETLRGDGTLYERGGAAMALGLLRIQESVPHLVSVWQDRGEKELMRAYAVVALGVLADPTDPPKLARFSIDHDYSLTNDPLNEVLSIY